MINTLILLVALSAVPCPSPARSQARVDAFKKANACPTKCKVYVREGSRFVLWKTCGRCQVDHICPLACCGPDTVDNMQWLTVEENLKKGADCTSCPIK